MSAGRETAVNSGGGGGGAGGDKAPQCGAVDTTTTTTHPLIRGPLASPRLTDFYPFFLCPRASLSFSISIYVIALIRFVDIIGSIT